MRIASTSKKRALISILVTLALLCSLAPLALAQEAPLGPTIVIMFILACGRIMSVGWEKAFLLQSPLTYETSDIISTYVYRKGFQEMDYSYSAAVGFFNSVVNLALLLLANTVSRRFGETGLL